MSCRESWTMHVAQIFCNIIDALLIQPARRWKFNNNKAFYIPLLTQLLFHWYNNHCKADCHFFGIASMLLWKKIWKRWVLTVFLLQQYSLVQPDGMKKQYSLVQPVFVCMKCMVPTCLFPYQDKSLAFSLTNTSKNNQTNGCIKADKDKAGKECLTNVVLYGQFLKCHYCSMKNCSLSRLIPQFSVKMITTCPIGQMVMKLVPAFTIFSFPPVH